MGTKLYVGNLSYDTTEADLRTFFGQVGTVNSCDVILDKYTNRSRGFGFVEMSSQEETTKAVNELNGKDLQGRALVVNEARPREDRPRNGGGGGGGFGGGGGGGRNSRPDRREKRDFGGGR